MTMTMKIILKVETVLTNSCNWSVYSPCFSWNKIIKFAYFLLCEMRRYWSPLHHKTLNSGPNKLGYNVCLWPNLDWGTTWVKHLVRLFQHQFDDYVSQRYHKLVTLGDIIWLVKGNYTTSFFLTKKCLQLEEIHSYQFTFFFSYYDWKMNVSILMTNLNWGWTRIFRMKK